MTTVRRMTEAETAPSTTNREGDTEESSTGSPSSARDSGSRASAMFSDLVNIS